MLRALLEAADHLAIGIAVLQISAPERVIYVNDGAAKIVGRSRAELEGASPFAILAPEAMPLVRELLNARGLGEAPPIVFETTAHRPDDTRIPIEVAMTRVVTPTATLNVTFIREISARIAATESLRQSEERFRKVVEGAPDGVVILQRGRITFMNALAADLLGVGDPKAGLGTLVTEHLVPEDAAIAGDRIGRMMATGASFEPMEYRTKVNPERYVEIKSILIDREGQPAVLAFARDVTARKRIQQELVRADRLASIGMMSAAVAHEINNPLAYAHLCLQFLERELPTLVPAQDRERVLEHVRNASHGIGRVATIVRDLRSFARPDDAEGSVDVVACIEQAVKLVESELRQRAQLVRDFEAVSAVQANASRLEQVFVNVLVNAAQAIADGDPTKHEIRITVRAQDQLVTIAISDTGPGIAPELRERIFEPFFSTKAVGIGTGLGLAVCRSIVEQFGGTIAVDPGVSRGAVLIVTLPVRREAAQVTPPVEAAEPRRLHVLVVDDEPLVRRALATVLGSHYEVSVAENGRQALEQIEANPIDVIICDVMMPVMTGKDLYEHLLVNNPVLARRFVFITGGSLGAVTSFLDRVSAQILYKPFELAKVLEVVAIAAER
ncbi:MAG: PAS domain S-box protein [Myxococcota bacterium]|nr:PAS domain S-box protein [Myxococcota bacterium]